MAMYFLIGKLTPTGQENLARNPNLVMQESQSLNIQGAQVLGQYAVLGHYDYLTMVEADSNDAVARLSAELGARTGLRFETLTGIRHLHVNTANPEDHQREHTEMAPVPAPASAA